MKKGFTLIELLIVIAVISILSAITLSVINVGRVRSRAQDATRREAISSIAGALERRYSDTNSYPQANNYTSVSSPAILNILQPTYIRVMPTDPTGQTYLYRSTDGQNFCLCYTSATEIESRPLSCPDPSGSANNVCIQNPF